MEAHVDDVICRATVRRGAMAQVARSLWGLDVGILRSTHAALITSLISYCLEVVGGTAYVGLLRRLEVQVANSAARRIVGVSRAARLGILHPVAGIRSARKLLIG